VNDISVIFAVIRRALDGGESVEIDGLGTFSKSGGVYRFAPQPEPQVFVAYVDEDLPSARRLCAALRRAGCSPWLDKHRLLAGQNWPRAIERAIESADVFLACFSRRAAVKHGQFQSELRFALDCARRLPLDATFLIPVRLDPCEVPRRLSEQLQWVDLFPDWQRGIARLLRAIRRAVRENRPARSRAIVVTAENRGIKSDRPRSA